MPPTTCATILYNLEPSLPSELLGRLPYITRRPRLPCVGEPSLSLTLMNTPNTPLIAHVSHVLLRQSSRHSPDSYPRLVSGSVRAAWRWADWAFVLQNFYRSRTVTALTFRFWRPSICYSLYYGVLRDRDPLTSKSENEQG